jgi:branched-chain amino acid transport system permease protein
VTLAATALILATLAMSVALLMSAGLPSLGQAAYLGVGAYTAAHLSSAGVAWAPAQLLAAGVAGAVAATVTAPVVLRARGTGFLMITFAVGELVHTAAQQWTPVTGGDEGLQVPPIVLWPGGEPLSQPGGYWYTLAVVVLVTAGLAWLGRTRLALAWRGLADHEPRLRALGHQVPQQLFACHVLAGAVAGLSGALLVAVNGYVSPADLDFTTATLALLVVVIGSGSLVGTILAALGVVTVRDGLGVHTGGHGLALLGLGFLIMAYRKAATDRLRNRRSARAGAA